MKKLKKLLLVLCVSLLTVTCVSVPSNAKEENTSKQEVIYINLNSDGSVDNIDVVNIFDLSKDQTIIDYGKYTSVSNMNTSDAITYENNKVSINASKGKVYYEGKLENKNIPWNFNIKYTMDGKSYSAEEIAGKSGKLKIDISIKQNKSVDESFFKAYALQVTLILDTNKASNIIASGATLANVGSDKQITYTILPDTEKDLTLTADVIDFEMDAIAINGVRMDLDVDLDTTELKDKVNDVKDAANELDDGSNELYDGVSKIQDGVNTLNSKSSELTNGSKEVKNGIALINSKLQESINIPSVDGLKTLSDGSTKFKTNLEDLKKSTTYDYYKDLVKKSTALNGSEGVDLDNLKSNNSDLISSLTSAANTEGITDEQKTLLTSAAQALAANNGVIDVTSAYFNGTNNDGLSAKTSALYAAYSSTDANNPGIDAGIQQVYTALGNSKDTLNKLSELKTGISELNTKYAELDEGINSYTDGVSELKDGVDKLGGGIIELKDGTKEFKDETTDIDTKIDDEIDNMKSTLTGSDYETISFVSSDNTNIESVQFVIQTKEIKKAEVEEVKVVEDTNTSIWDKFLDLFR